MRSQYIYPSLTRISDLPEKKYTVKKIRTSKWNTGDYVVCRILDPGSNELLLELCSGRMRGVIGGEYVVGVLGERYATLEATGTWKKVKGDGNMSVLTGAGLLGKLTSKSVFIPNMMEVKYKGHVHRDGKKVTMDAFVTEQVVKPFTTPVVLFVGTSMSAGKTTSARIVTNLFKSAGYKVVGGKLSGAGRYKDILAIKDVGADAIFDFVDVGLPSSICDPKIYKAKLQQLLQRMTGVKADVAIIEVGASPLEPYNGNLAIEAIRDNIKCVVLSASDPYAVYGIMTAFDIVPDIVTGISTNTLAGIEMVERLCKVKALNIIDSKTATELKKIVTAKTGLKL
ncbi:MAG: hypothetical protein HKN52_02620 [Eudoraea sp.]|nr:hypothetical protein [Eudoraea sp.]